MSNERIKMDMTGMDTIVALVDGNPGAISVCMELLTRGGKIDPDNWIGGLGFLLDLDTLHIYGPRIWMLYKDVCGQDIVKVVALLRAWQLGQLKVEALNTAIDNWGEGIDHDAIMAAIKEILPNFNPATTDDAATVAP